MAIKEAVVQSWVRDYLEDEYGDKCYAFKVPQGQYTSRRGLPDLVFSIHGHFLGIEVKTDTGKITKLQEHELQKINKAGATAAVIYGKDTEKMKAIVSTMNRLINSGSSDEV